ncbi:Putative cytochrome P450 137 [Mycobacterium simulans]|uniref:cytochrome P450 n=1 Tax=Mycobacterium simulans TaxID=627089 RepID=UPI00174A9703|nr:cytochrome P450 [Mycobacterium simulans]SON61064.1 Putative cytochrome P450 137 [Mycobacterium simulans]
MIQFPTARRRSAQIALPRPGKPRFRDWLRSVLVGLDPEAYFRRRANHEDPFVVIFPGLGPVHFFTTAADCQRILTAPQEVWCAPTPNPIEPIVGPSSVILTSGEHHRRQRRLLSPALHGDRMRQRAGSIARAVRTEINTWRPGDQVALHRTATSITLRVIIETVLGICDHRAGEYADVVTELINANTAPLLLLPALRRSIADRGPWARLVLLRARFQGMLFGQIEYRRQCPYSGHGAMLSHLLRETDDKGAHFDTLDEEDLQQQLRTMVIAGHDTTAAALAWALYHIHRDADVHARLTRELSTDPAPHEMPKLPYLTAVINETLRMHPPVPIVLRKVVEPRSVGGIQFSTGDILGIAIPAIHFSNDPWHDPYRFNPDRFFDNNPTPFEYLPFGGGYRRCLGAAFANYELAIAIGTIMRTVGLAMPRRELRRNPPSSVPRGIAVVPRRDVKLVVTAAPAS